VTDRFPTDPHEIRILLIDESPERSELLQKTLHASGYRDLVVYHQTQGLLEKVAELRPDVVLIEVDSPRRDTLEQLSSVRDRRPTPVVMFTQDPDAQSIEAAVSSGVSAYIVDGINPAQVRPAIDVAMSTFRSFAALRGQLQQAKQELSEHKRIDRAKAILMNQYGISENEAYAAIRKLAMDRKRKLINVADDLIAMSKMFS
jgi:response regulator NasT